MKTTTIQQQSTFLGARLSQSLAALSLFTLSGLSAAYAGDISIDESNMEPLFVAGGHYTAEVDFSKQALTLLPLAEEDQVLAFESCEKLRRCTCLPACTCWALTRTE